MGLFKLARTFVDPASSQSGFATPGDGAQMSGDPSYASIAGAYNDGADYQPVRPTKGRRTFFGTRTPVNVQQGMAAPLAPNQRRSRGEMPNSAPLQPGVLEQVWTPFFSRGAAAFVPQTGKVLTNPIGAGVVALHRPLPSYGSSGQYIDNAIWWTNQVIPTTINLQGLTDAEELNDIVGSLNVQAMVRTTG